MTKPACSNATSAFTSQSDQPARHAPELAPSIRQRWVGLAFSSILRLLSTSWRVRVEGIEILDELAASKRRHILAFWHQHYITLFSLVRDRPVVVVTNQSQRGQIIADICHRNGMRTLQVGEGGSMATLESLERATADGHGLGIAVDGPLGPAGKVKRVVAHLAARLECPIVPISVSAHPKYVLTNRWDRLEIPHVFSRVSFVVGEPLKVSSAVDRTELQESADCLQLAIKTGEHIE